ncbi:MAG: hypothetical protein KatS3mg102_2536 [Planctomycetota bacterium]|nr:MAG: hypothetical protein KatS3mg102_2536 [Planctomycetota bacterium]
MARATAGKRSWWESLGAAGHRRLLAVLVLAVGSTAALPGCDGAPDAAASPTVAARPPTVAIPVAVTTAGTLPDVAVSREVARLLPWRSYTVAAAVAGQVLEVRREVGERVAADDPIVVRLDAEPYRIALARARAALAAAEARRDWAALELARAQELFAQQQLSTTLRERAEIELRVATAEHAAAAAALAAAELDLARTEVRLEPGLIITARLLEPGAHATPGIPLLAAIDARRLRLRFEVGADMLAACQPGSSIAFEVKELGGRRRATVIRAGPEADPRTHRFPIEAEVAPASDLLPGMTAVAIVRLERSAKPLVVVPRAALYESFAERWVAVVNADRTIERRPVALREAPQLPPDLVAIEGVAPGEQLALERLLELEPATRVEPRPEPSGPASYRQPPR